MKFQTTIALKEQRPSINYNSKIVLLGSCFAENIGEKFDYFKFHSTRNPFGILFHPIALEKLITRAINRDYYIKEELRFVNEQWCSLDAHSKCNRQTPEELLDYLNTSLDSCLEALKSGTHLVITLGTSWVYRHIETDQIVANCHKLPQKEFLKELLPTDIIDESLQAIISLCKRLNPDITIIFTVSPVRHLKDGMVENMRSKTHLLVALHNLIAEDKSVVYFPSFELMMDELRDYRFYAEDMIHPSNLAINYIWNRFSEIWIGKESYGLMKKVESVQKRLSHKPFNANSQQHLEFKNKIDTDIRELKASIPYLIF